MLTSQPYIKIDRYIKNNVQQLIEIEENLVLYKNEIISATDHFQLNEVTDISYRFSSSSSGFLYLHTIRGVYPFQIKTNPSKFIHMYQQLKAK